MFNPPKAKSCAVSWAHHRRQQERALAGEISIWEITTVVVGDDSSFVEDAGVNYSAAMEALTALPFTQLTDEAFDFMAAHFSVRYLIPVADPRSPGATWPSIIVPREDDFIFDSYTGEEQDRILEILRDWRSTVDLHASTIPCSPLGWIGGVWLPHPDGPDEMCMHWPWLHRPYCLEGRPGDSQLFDLFKVAVDRHS